MVSPLLILPILSGVMWGAAGVFVRTLSSYGMDSMTIVLSRVLLATLMMLALILMMDKRLLRIKPRDIWMFLACGLAMIMLNVFYTDSVDRVSLSLAAVLLSLSPVFMLILAAAIFRERITGRKIICMLASILGCVMVSGVMEGGASTLSVHGIAAGLASAFFYALYGILSKKTASHGYTTYTILFYTLLVSTIVILPLSDPGMVVDYAMQGPADFGYLVLHAAVASFLPYILYTTAMARGEAGTSSLLAACGEPVAAAVFGLVIFAEVPSLLMLAGMALAIGSMAYMCSPSKPKPREPEVVRYGNE